MEAKFEVRFMPSRKMVAELCRAVLPMKLFYVLGAGLMALFVISLSSDGTTEILWMALEIGIFALLFHFFPDLYAWWLLKQDKKQNGGESRVLIGDTVEDCTGALKVSFPLEKITEVRHLKYSYVIMSGRKYAIMLDPNCFIEGTFAEFKQFLREKRPDLTIPE